MYQERGRLGFSERVSAHFMEMDILKEGLELYYAQDFSMID